MAITKIPTIRIGKTSIRSAIGEKKTAHVAIYVLKNDLK